MVDQMCKVAKKIFLIALLFIQNTFCMTKIIGESLAYRESPSAIVSETNKAIFEDERNATFFSELTDEILRWQHTDFFDVAFECLKSSIDCRHKKATIAAARSSLRSKLRGVWLEEEDYKIALAGEILKYDGTDELDDIFDWGDSHDLIGRACIDSCDKCYQMVKDSITAINQHISFVRIITVDKVRDEFYFRINCVPFLFLSGTIEANAAMLIRNPLKTLARFIDSYGFYSSSDQAYSHSERAICLALSTDFGDRCLLSFTNENTIDLCIQIRNLSRMCVNCEHFIFGRDIYFTNVGGKGCFVTYEYKNDYEDVTSVAAKRDFIKKYSKALRLGFSNERINLFQDGEINNIFAQIVPKNILDLIPCENALVLETMSADRISEVVKIYLP